MRASGSKTLAKTATRRLRLARLRRRRRPAAGTIRAAFTRSSRASLHSDYGVKGPQGAAWRGACPCCERLKLIRSNRFDFLPVERCRRAFLEGRAATALTRNSHFRSPTTGQQRSTALRGDRAQNFGTEDKAKRCPSSSTPTPQPARRPRARPEDARASSSRSATPPPRHDSPSRRREEGLILLETRNREKKF